MEAVILKNYFFFTYFWVVLSFQIICSEAAEDNSRDGPAGTMSRCNKPSPPLCVVNGFCPALSGSSSGSNLWADVRNSCVWGKRGRGKGRGREREEGRGEKKEEEEKKGGKKTFTFCGFLGSGQRPRIPHATHTVSIRLNPSLHQNASPPLTLLKWVFLLPNWGWGCRRRPPGSLQHPRCYHPRNNCRSFEAPFVRFVFVSTERAQAWRTDTLTDWGSSTTGESCRLRRSSGTRPHWCDWDAENLYYRIDTTQSPKINDLLPYVDKIFNYRPFFSQRTTIQGRQDLSVCWVCRCSCKNSIETEHIRSQMKVLNNTLRFSPAGISRCGDILGSRKEKRSHRGYFLYGCSLVAR